MARAELNASSSLPPASEPPAAEAIPTTTGGEPIHLETPTLRGDVAMAAACLTFGLIGYFVIVPAAVYVPAKFAGTVNSPDFLPKLVLLLLSGFSALYLVKSLAAWIKTPAEGWAPRADWMLAGGTALICAGFVAAIFLVGLTLAAAICVAATMGYFGERRPTVIAPVAILLPLALWYFFEKMANILFPPPLWGIMGWLEASIRPVLQAGGIA